MDELETARSGSPRCIPLLRVPLRSQQPPSSCPRRMLHLVVVFELRIWFTEIARVYRVGWHEKDEEEESRIKRRRERERGGREKSVGTKEDQRRTDRARINCRNTGSSLSTSATHGFSSVGKYVECILNVSPTFLRSRGCGSLFPLI